jgi:hypothetical protein
MGVSKPICARKEASCSGVTKAPKTFLATLPGEDSVMRKTATETKNMVRSSKRNLLTINFAITFSIFQVLLCSVGSRFFWPGNE